MLCKIADLLVDVPPAGGMAARCGGYKEAYYNSFATPADFFAWRTKAQAAEQTDGGSTTVIDSGGTIDVRN